MISAISNLPAPNWGDKKGRMGITMPKPIRSSRYHAERESAPALSSPKPGSAARRISAQPGKGATHPSSAAPGRYPRRTNPERPGDALGDHLVEALGLGRRRRVPAERYHRAHLGQLGHGAQVPGMQGRLADHEHQAAALLQCHVGRAGSARSRSRRWRLLTWS